MKRSRRWYLRAVRATLIVILLGSQTACSQGIARIGRGDVTIADLPTISAPMDSRTIFDHTYQPVESAAAYALTPVFSASPLGWAVTYAYSCALQSSGISFSVEDAAGTESPDWAGSVSDESNRTVGAGVAWYHFGGSLRLQLSILDSCEWRLLVTNCNSIGCASGKASDGVYTFAGGTGVATPLFTVPSSWTIAYTYDCSASQATSGSPDFSVNIWQPSAPSDNQELSVELGQATVAGGAMDYMYQQAGTYYAEVTSGCPWTVRLGPSGRVTGFANLQPVPPIALPQASPGQRTLLDQSGVGNVVTAPVTLPESAWSLVATADCYRYANPSDELLTVSLEPADASSPQVSTGSALFPISIGTFHGSASFTSRGSGSYALVVSAAPGCDFRVAVRA